MILWLNGSLVDEREAVIPAGDHGFLYGMGLFETFRTYGGRPFLLEEHAARLRAGCAALRIRYEPDPAQIRRAAERLLAANGLADAVFRWSVSAGPAPPGLPGAEGYGRPNVLLSARPLPAAAAQPKELHLLRLRRSSPEGAVRYKSFHYMNNILGKWELAERTPSPRAEGLFLDGAGRICEGVVSNVFWVSGGTLFTPSPETGCLPGITRGAVIALAERAGIPVREGGFPFAALADADKAFVTNSVQEVAPAAALYGADGAVARRWEAAPGPVTARLTNMYREWTRTAEGAP